MWAGEFWAAADIFGKTVCSLPFLGMCLCVCAAIVML